MKILHIDIETSYIIGAVWGMWEQNVATTLQDWYVLGVGYQWNHLKGVHWIGLPDYPNFKQDKTDDSALMKECWELLNEADVVIGHNAKQFDVKKLNTRFLLNGLPPPAPYQVMDTKLIAKRYFSFASNKLDELSRQMEGERKLKHEGIDLWTKCMEGDMKAWKTMETYCKHDVELLKKKYDRFLPWIDNHPNRNVYNEENGCPNCGSAQLQPRGFAFSRVSKKQRFRCGKCGAWSTGKTELSVSVR